MRSEIVVRMMAALAGAMAVAVAMPAMAHSLSYDRAYAFGTQAPGVAVAVDQGTGNVFVAIAFDSTFLGTIKRFDSAGDALSPASFGSGNYGGVAFDEDAQRVHALDTDLLAGFFGATPAPAIESFTPTGDASGSPIAVSADGFDFNQIAVGPDGVIYHPSAVTDSVQRFTPDGTPLEPIGGGGALVNPSGVAVHGGDLYVVDGVVNGGFAGADDPTNGRVQRFSTDGGPPLATVDDANASSVGVDPTSGRVLVGNGLGASFEVVVYDRAGPELTRFGSGRFGASGFFGGFGNEIAVSRTGRVYVSDPGSNEVEMFDVLPTVTTGAATAVDHDSATLAGTVDSNGGSLLQCRFEYGTTTAYGHTAPCGPSSGPASGLREVTADVAGLSPSTEYHFRLVATNLGGTANGADRTFTTGAAPVDPTPPTPPAPPAAPPVAAPPPPCVTGCGGASPVGKVTVPRSVKVRGGRARIRVTCKGAPGAVCRGSLKLVARVRPADGGKARRRRIGRTTCDLRAGASTTLRVRLSRGARRALARRGSLRARVSAPGLKGQVITLRGAKEERTR